MGRWPTQVGYLSRWSLRARLVAVLLMAVTLVLAVASTAAVVVLRSHMMAAEDHDLRAAVAEISRGSTIDKAWSAGQSSDELVFGGYYFEVRQSDGRIATQRVTQRDGSEVWVKVRASESLTGPSVPDMTGVLAAAVDQSWSVGDPDALAMFTVPGVAVDSEDDLFAGEGPPRWRVMVKQRVLLSKDFHNDSWGTLVVAKSLESTDRTIGNVQRGLIILSLGVLAAAGLGGVAALRGALAPLREIEQVAEAITAGDRTLRVPVRPETTEVGRLGGTLNSMLDQLEATLKQREASEARMRQFVGDASHELRTPLASVRGFAELYRQGALSDAEAVSGAFGRIEHEAKRMGGLVEDLLLLARLDEQRPLVIETVDLCVLAGDVVHDATSLAPDRNVVLQGFGGGAPRATLVCGDDARLRQVLTNLMSNAIRYTPAGSPIEVAVGPDEHGAVVQVIDHGLGVSPEDAERIFGRFFRVDASRQRATGGAGLGLAIVASIVNAHSGQVHVLQTPGGGATFEVRLPAAQETPCHN